MLFSLSGVTMLYAAALLFGLSRSNAPVVSVAIIDLFGRRAVGSLVGTLFMYHQLFAAAGAFAGGLVYDRFGSYDIMLGVALASMVSATVSSLLIIEPRLTRERLVAIDALPSTVSGD
jgi:predicted MFS family arabinose efflux permease